MRELQSLLDEIRSELSTDIYYAYTDGRYLILETVAVSIAVACLVEYLKALFGLREAGEEHRKYIKDFIESVRAQDMISIKAEMDALEREASRLTSIARPSVRGCGDEAAIESLNAVLIEMGMPARQAELHSKNIAHLVGEYLREKGGVIES